jgi:hypothetical protein
MGREFKRMDPHPWSWISDAFHREPDPASRRYRALATLARGKAFESSSVPGFALRVDALLE